MTGSPIGSVCTSTSAADQIVDDDGLPSGTFSRSGVGFARTNRRHLGGGDLVRTAAAKNELLLGRSRPACARRRAASFGSRSPDRRARIRAASSRHRDRVGRAAIGNTAQTARRPRALRPTRCRASGSRRESAAALRALRSASVSSMRRTNWPPCRARQQPVEQRGAHAADVQIAGGTGSEAGANGH